MYNSGDPWGRPNLIKEISVKMILEKYISPETVIIRLNIQSALLVGGSEISDWGGEGAGDEPKPGF